MTDATEGLGAEFARQLAAAKYDPALVARDAERLWALAERLQDEYGVRVETIAADLVAEEGIAVVTDRISRTADPISLLVNNAGFGLIKSFERNPVQSESDHLQLHVRTPMLLMHAVLPGMLERGAGRIINVASVAAFLPRASYGAAKAWTVSFSRWANLHYGARGVKVLALCPG
ncbi:SDR family NAD(P)-dependent oxidoreductase [Acaricomes phytoseiuli]|nr:SDR family NAD(P)-dependent oxidoreductase [Acaricomes phytoseiuli]